jgi:hypothetical protein
MGDFRCCLEPLGVDVSELRAPAADQQGEMNTVFEAVDQWIPLVPIGWGSERATTRSDAQSSLIFNPRRWFG